MSSWPVKNKVSSFTKNRFCNKAHFSFSLSSEPSSRKSLSFSIKAELDNKPSSSTVVSEEPSENINTQKSELSGEEVDQSGNSESEKIDEEEQEKDWKTDEEFKKFMGNPSIEAAIKLEKKRADRKLKELDRENSSNPLVGLFNRVVKDSLTRERERLEKAEETFKALDLNKVLTLTPRIVLSELVL